MNESVRISEENKPARRMPNGVGPTAAEEQVGGVYDQTDLGGMKAGFTAERPIQVGQGVICSNCFFISASITTSLETLLFCQKADLCA